MQVSEEKNGNVLVLDLSGRLDSATSPEFEKILLGHVGSGDNRLVLDLAGLDYISSAGLRILLMGAKRTRQEAGAMVLCNLKAPIAEVLRMSGFLAILSVTPSRDEALEQAAA